MEYSFGFILSTSLGNRVRYHILRKYAERVQGVKCEWAPIRHFFAPDEKDPVRYLPGPFHDRAVVLNQAWPVMRRLKSLDAVMIHSFEVQPLIAFRNLHRRSPVLFAGQDNPPMIDPSDFPGYPDRLQRSAARRRARLSLELWTARHTDQHICFSEWQARTLVDKCGLPSERVHAVHTGLDLEEWSDLGPREISGGPPEILFVGGDFERKGGPILLEMFSKYFSGRAHLHLVTGAELQGLPPNVTVHKGLAPGSEQLRSLFRRADIFALPTTADFSSWVCLEAMANRLPVIASRVGGIPDMVAHGRSGLLVDVGDKSGLESALRSLLDDAALRTRMGAEGRALVEANFNAAKNVPKILDIMKLSVDLRVG